MSMTLQPCDTPDSEQSALKGWLAVLAVALGIFALMTSELLPVGLLTPVGATLNVSNGTAGLMVTVPGVVAAISAPAITVVAGRVDRRLVLCLLIGLMGAANLVSAFAQSFATVLVARVLIGVSVGGFWAIAGGLALRLVPQQQVGRATAVILSGVSIASVLGVPAGTLIGELAGWRSAFAVVGLLGLAALAGLIFLLPSLPATQTLSLPELPRLIRANTGVLIGVIVTFLLITGHFTAFTFVRPILTEITGIDSGLISMLLLVNGVAGIVGNFAAGAPASRDVRRTVLVIAVSIAAALMLIAVLGREPIGGIALMIVWGLVYGALGVALQTWMLKAAPQATEAASALFVAMFNLSIALGALIGGFAVDGIATASVLWIGGGLALLAAVPVWAQSRLAYLERAG
jgi:predicted MFS family arabinose efflux permease